MTTEVLIPDPNGHYDFAYAVAYLKCSPRKLRDLVARKEITYVRIGLRLSFLGADLIALVKSHRRLSNAELSQKAASRQRKF